MEATREFRIENYAGMARTIVFGRGINSRHADFDDLVQAALLGILNASRAEHRPADSTFSTFAFCCGKNAVSDMLRIIRRRESRFMQMDEGVEREASETREWRSIDAKVCYDSAMGHCENEQQRALFELVYRDGFTRREAAREVGICKSTATVWCETILEKVREERRNSLRLVTY